jgi:citrate/tricarballylate utilization protein
MSLDSTPHGLAAAIAPDGRSSLPLLIKEASRQLAVCNACRYCEGLCAVFPALERRSVLQAGDISQLANLCHDCRACFDGCMYDPPHEFDLDIPKALSAVRVADYQRYVWPPRVPRAFSGWSGVALGALASSLIVLLIAVAHAGWSGLVRHGNGPASPYGLIPYPALITLMLAAGLYSVVVMALAARTYWREVGGGHFGARPVLQAVWYAATLRYLRGGGGDCYYPVDDRPSSARRRLHAMVAYGFGLCLVSTVAAAVLQDIADVQPPYPFVSVPVLSGTVGGIGLVVGCVGLLGLKTRSSAVTSFAQMTIKDYGLLTALAFLALSGLATLLTRDTAAFGIVFLIHMAALVESFAMAPYSKFVHLVFRFAALVRDNLERAGSHTA